MINRALLDVVFLTRVLKALLVSVLLTGYACAENNLPEVKVIGESPDRGLSVAGQIFDLSAMSIDLRGTWGDYVLVAANSGGSGCPTSHYWLDLGKTPPVLSDFFGDCYESLNITE